MTRVRQIKLRELVKTEINGNLKDAKEMAKDYSLTQIRLAYQSYAGYSLRKALLTAKWLKGSDCYQAACDCE